MFKARFTFFFILLTISYGYSQDENQLNFTSDFVQIKGLGIHYLDFGGKGIPVILIHSEAWDAYTFKEFGALLSKQNRVLAVTRPGYGDSGTGNYDVPSQGDYLMAFADALGIENAIYIGNSSVTSELTYLAEHYPNRIAGVVYLSGLAVPWLDIYSKDSTRAFEMFMRASPGNNNKENISRARSLYRPRHLTSDSISIAVPALAFVSKSGRMGTENGVNALVLSGSPLMEELRNDIPPSPTKNYLDRIAHDVNFRNEEINNIDDSVARKYFIQLANDSILQRKVYQFHMEMVLPAMLSAQDAFVRAYGNKIQLIRLDVPQIIGYEYRDSPQLILSHIQRFLKELSMD